MQDAMETAVAQKLSAYKCDFDPHDDARRQSDGPFSVAFDSDMCW